MKFIAILIALIILVYFGADHLLSSHLETTTAIKPGEEKALVQNMARFLERSPVLQNKISSVGIKNERKLPEGVSIKLAQYFGSTPTDDFFLTFITKRMKTDPNNIDAQTKLMMELNEYIRLNPKDSIECLESAFQSMPLDMNAELNVMTPAFIHSSIHFIEELNAEPSTKKMYLKRFISNTQNLEIKNALEGHFPDLMKED